MEFGHAVVGEIELGDDRRVEAEPGGTEIGVVVQDRRRLDVVQALRTTSNSRTVSSWSRLSAHVGARFRRPGWDA